MRLSLAAVLCLAACSGPEQYERGVRPITPRPPTFRPHEDAPHDVGHPGYRGHPGVPRGQDRRHIQPRRDGRPQVSASDGDRERAIRLLLSEPAPRAFDGISEAAHRKCWSEALGLMRQEPRLYALTAEEVRCRRLLLYYYCGAFMVDAAERGARGFLERYPGKYDSGKFEDSVAGEQARKDCGEEREHMTRRSVEIERDLRFRGNELGWRNPEYEEYRH